MRPINSRTKSYLTNREGIIDNYLNDICNFDILPDKKIKQLLPLAKKGDGYAIDKIVRSYQRFIFYISKRLSSGNNSLLLDLVSEANIGLMLSIERFNKKYDNNFLTFSRYYMQKKIYEYLTYTNKAIKQSNKSINLKVKTIKNDFYLKNGRNPELEEIREILKEKYDIVSTNNLDLLDMDIQSKNDDRCKTDENDPSDYYERKYTEEMSNENDYEKYLEDDYSKTIINKAIGILTPKEQEVIKLLYGIDQYNELDMKSVGEQIGMTASAISAINTRALDKMREVIECGCGSV